MLRLVACAAVVASLLDIASAGAGQVTPGLNPGRNVLVLLADDVGVDVLRAYGEGTDYPSTPNLDALAAQGVLFRNAWSSPKCSPTRAGIMTGRHAFRTGIGSLVLKTGAALPLSETTIPELLDMGGSGYAHALFGKWHLGNSSVGGLLAPNAAGWSWFDGTECSLEPSPPLGYYSWPRVVNGQQQYSTSYATEVQISTAADWIKSAPEPWVCFVTFHTPHGPFHAPPPGTYTQSLETPQPVPGGPLRPFYMAMIENMDYEVGRLLSQISGHQISPPVIIFTADNGTPTQVSQAPFLPQHAKGTLYEGGINVPLIVTGWLGQWSDTECAALVHTNDLFATVADIAGLDAAALLSGKELDSLSLLPFVVTPGLAGRTTLFSEVFSQCGLPPANPQRAARDARYKLIRKTLGDEFYDLLLDPFEQSNLLVGAGLGPQQQAAYDRLVNSIVALTGGP